MASQVFCHGCGLAFDVPADYRRNKIQCPGCGVICAVPAGAARPPAPAKASRPAAEDEAADWFRDEPSRTVPDDDDAPIEADVEEEPRPAEALVLCRRCGRKVRRQRECPMCDAVPAAQGPGVVQMELADGSLTDEDDDSPYDLCDKLGPTCPKCHVEMLPDAVVCVKCGFNRRTRKKAARRYEPMARVWESDRPLSQRLLFLAIAQGYHLLIGLLVYWLWGTFLPAIIAWFPLTAMLCFLLGTYDRIELTRDERGRVRITKQWRFAFVPLHPMTTDVRGYEGVVSGPWQEVGILEWFVLLSLLGWGIIPGLIWYYTAIHTPHFHVALALDHGHPSLYIYRGRNQDQMNDIADTLCAATGLQRLG